MACSRLESSVFIHKVLLSFIFLFYRIWLGLPEWHPESRAWTSLLQRHWGSWKPSGSKWRKLWANDSVITEHQWNSGLVQSSDWAADERKKLFVHVWYPVLTLLCHRPLSVALSRLYASPPLPVTVVYGPPAATVATRQDFTYHSTDSAEVRSASPHCPPSHLPPAAEGENVMLESSL